jgi:putative oxidoreductase
MLFFIFRILVGGVFVIASIDKIAYPEEFVKIVVSYQITPSEIAQAFSYILPWAELILGIFLLVGLYTKKVSFIVSILLFIFILALLSQVIQGTKENCGCFTNIPLLSSSNPFVSIFRDIILLTMAIVVYYRTKGHELSWRKA